MRLRHNYRARPSRRNTGSRGGWSVGSLAPTLWLDAQRTPLGGSAAPNLASSGPALDARYGSTSGVDVTDPVLLPHTGVNYLYTTGVVGNNASVPNLAAYQLSEFDIQVDVDLGGNPAALSSLLAMWNTGALGYGFHVSSGGFLQLYGSPDGTANTFVASSVAATLTGRILLRCTRRTSDGRVQFFTAPPSASPVWTQLGTDQFLYAGLSLFASTQPLRVGQNGGSQPTTGKFYSAKLIADPFGTPTIVFHADFTTGITSGGQTTFTESSANAATVTINRSITGRKSTAVVRPVWLFGTDDYMEVAADPNGAYLQTTGAANSNAFAPYVSFDTGTCTGGAGTTSTTLEDTTKAWVVNDRAQRMVRITGGTGVGQIRSIASNTATQLTVSVAWTTIPDATSTYVIESRGNVGGDIEIVVRCALDNWASGSNQPLVAKRATGQYSYYAYMAATGNIALSCSFDGTTVPVQFGSVVAPFTNGTAYWIRIRRTASTGVITAEYAADQATEPTTWTTLSTNTLSAGNIWQGTADVAIAGVTGLALSAGKFYAAIVREGTLAHVVWYAYGHSTTGATYANTQRLAIQVGSAASIVNSNPLNFGASDSFTVIAVARRWTAPPASGVFISKWSNGGGWHMRNGFGTPTQPLIALNNGTTTTNSAMPTPTLGGVDVFAAVVSPTDVFSYWNNTAFSIAWSAVSTSSEVPVSIGRVPFGSSYNDMELLAVAVIPSALTTEQIAQVVAYYN